MSAGDQEEQKLRLNPRYQFQWEEAQDCYVLLYPEGLIRLSGSAAEIIRRCTDGTTEAQLIAELKQAFPDAEGLEEDVKEFLQEARQQEWLVNEPGDTD